MKILNFLISCYTTFIIVFLIAIVWTLSLPIATQIVFTVIGAIDCIAFMIQTIIEINKGEMK